MVVEARYYCAKTFFSNFYGIYDTPLTTISSTSRLEDHLSQSTFPHVIPEVHEISNIEILPLLKDLATSWKVLFKRKKSAKERDFKTYKVAGICLDSNNILKTLNDPAANSKFIILNWKKLIHKDKKWKKLESELKKEKLFSLIYDKTKDWKDKDVFEKLDEIEEVITKELK